ncbi:unnamed protein product [Bemisia tabaci]|uniref:RRM domain-containing protein n=1 Tax=Bemisia tabaci TaxID=7038 RepID=A0A9P0F078_BEMTA|nr:unnamed protein product [Bemisia tabaci]
MTRKKQELNTQKNCCVQIQNMAKSVGYADIEKFFQGLEIVPKGIKMINDDDGNRSGLAYVRFVHDGFKNQALKLNGRPMKGQWRETRVKVTHLDDYIYNEAIDDFHPPEKKLRPVGPVFDTLKLSQLPRYTKEKEVMALFTNVRPRNVIIYPNKHLCDAFVEFESPQEAELAASLPLMMGRHHVVTEPVFDKDPNLHLSAVGNNMFLANQSGPEIPPPRQDPRRKSLNEKETISPVPPRHVPEPSIENTVPVSDCLLLKGLPFKANDRDILDFFSDVGIVPLKIHIMFDKQGKPAGDAFCEFNTPEEANRGLVKQNAPMDRNIVTVVPIPRHEMMCALGILPPGPMMPPHMAGPGMPAPRMPPGMMGPPMGHPGDMRMPMHHRPTRPDFIPGGPNFRGHRMENDYINDSINVDGFGKPGCVVSMENVPFSAGVEDILHFFHGFDVVRQNIIRRFDDDGKPTGDARVCLKTQADAQRACQKLHKRMIGHRIIYLSIVD